MIEKKLNITFGEKELIDIPYNFTAKDCARSIELLQLLQGKIKSGEFRTHAVRQTKQKSIPAETDSSHLSGQVWFI